MHAKRVSSELADDELPPQKAFPLEAVTVFVGQENMMSDTGDSLCFQGQWLFQNVIVHDTIAGLKAMTHKEEIQRLIEDHINLGEEGLDPRDHYLLEVDLEDLETTSGMEQAYWLLQLQAARRESTLRQGAQTASGRRDRRERRA